MAAIFWACHSTAPRRPTAAIGDRRLVFRIADIEAKPDCRHPLAGRSQGPKQYRATQFSLRRSTNCSLLTHYCVFVESRPVSHSASCEPNRARHPSGSSVSRYPATALAAVAAPEKRWCQSMSKCVHHIRRGCLTTPVLEWLIPWAIQNSIRMAQRRRPIIRGG